MTLKYRKLTFIYKNILRFDDCFIQFPIFVPNKLM